MKIRRGNKGLSLLSMVAKQGARRDSRILDCESFQKMISIERKRTERSRKPFLLMLLDIPGSIACEENGKLVSSIISALLASTRETDVTGWYTDQSMIGTIFTELGIDEKGSFPSTMLSRVKSILKNSLTLEQLSEISISFYVFPDDWHSDISGGPGNPTLFPDLARRDNAKRFLLGSKRIMDILGSAFALVVCAPIFLMIALSIKVTSEGPVFFRQKRVGQHGKSFTFLKFRSMYVNSDSSVHQEYVRQFIAGQADPKGLKGSTNGVYKLTADSRITRVGGFLRRASLDELPQLLNVLKGEMSLVGPRPPVPYEVEAYDIWHRRRLLEAKPGITGLWQVNGRSRVNFDEMVRLDLRYIREWSPWLDFEILLRTPWAVLKGKGAY